LIEAAAHRPGIADDEEEEDEGARHRHPDARGCPIVLRKAALNPALSTQMLLFAAEGEDDDLK
jgi:hypothetical protein